MPKLTRPTTRAFDGMTQAHLSRATTTQVQKAIATNSGVIE